MIRFLLIGLMAASALVPASAMAQERGERPRREAADGNRSQRDSQRQRPERAPQAPQRDYQNQRPQVQGRAPQQDFQRVRPAQGARRERPEGWTRPDRGTPQRWQGGERRPDARAEDRRGWENRNSQGGDRVDRGERRPDQVERNDRQNWGDRAGRVERDGRGRPGQREWQRRDDNRDWRDRDDRRRSFADRNWRDDTRQRQSWDDRRSWSRSWRSDRRYDWNGYRQANRNVYRLPRYYPPSGYGYGYGYQRFSIGLTLGSMLYGSGYWINDPYAYRLPPADGPYRWVRYYNDALLVDLETGEVVDTVYDLFW
ncbi:RcnB family protein [Sphingomonas sp. PL-96]|uniref:RcnB family protein n=1 Tax=Sphingomonas sp. PL-96 TaxID=2887201 RepID=UPI001E3F8FB0|nr:RcnB family protein [Sphingomonas sp. PL-96]MCC2976693.1 RcnB family protein [Sphingomonas sp. PL-96]